jgi:hypothetical protein
VKSGLFIVTIHIDSSVLSCAFCFHSFVLIFHASFHLSSFRFLSLSLFLLSISIYLSNYISHFLFLFLLSPLRTHLQSRAHAQPPDRIRLLELVLMKIKLAQARQADRGFQPAAAATAAVHATLSRAVQIEEEDFSQKLQYAEEFFEGATAHGAASGGVSAHDPNAHEGHLSVQQQQLQRQRAADTAAIAAANRQVRAQNMLLQHQLTSAAFSEFAATGKTKAGGAAAAASPAAVGTTRARIPQALSSLSSSSSSAPSSSSSSTTLKSALRPASRASATASPSLSNANANTNPNANSMRSSAMWQQPPQPSGAHPSSSSSSSLKSSSKASSAATSRAASALGRH